MLVTQSRILYKKCARFLYKKLTNHKKQRQTTQTTNIVSSQQTSRPITSVNFGHASPSFLHQTELFWCKILVQEKTCTRKHDTQSSFLYNSICTSFLYRIIDCVWVGIFTETYLDTPWHIVTHQDTETYRDTPYEGPFERHLARRAMVIQRLQGGRTASCCQPITQSCLWSYRCISHVHIRYIASTLSIAVCLSLIR